MKSLCTNVKIEHEDFQKCFNVVILVYFTQQYTIFFLRHIAVDFRFITCYNEFFPGISDDDTNIGKYDMLLTTIFISSYLLDLLVLITY
jgi:hypothetical protein